MDLLACVACNWVNDMLSLYYGAGGLGAGAASAASAYDSLFGPGGPLESSHSRQEREQREDQADDPGDSTFPPGWDREPVVPRLRDMLGEPVGEHFEGENPFIRWIEDLKGGHSIPGGTAPGASKA